MWIEPLLPPEMTSGDFRFDGITMPLWYGMKKTG
jgi:hypothetical protein